jgi:hypothetical protein
MDLQAVIDSLVWERQQRWAVGLPAGDLTQQIDDAWAKLRAQRAEAQHGSTAAIIAQARVERELEKLMSEEA